MKINCAITDDEPFARKGMVSYIERIPFLQLQGVCESALELNELLKSTRIDLVFLDIEMPLLNGIDWINTSVTRPMIIITTAYDQYALKGYELDVVDYLMKPISFERFLKAANKAEQIFKLKETPTTSQAFYLKSEGKLYRIQFDDLLFVESIQNYVLVYTNQGKYISHQTLKSLLQQLPENVFVQTHKSYIVAKNKISSIEGNQIKVNEWIIPISKNNREEVLKKLLH